MLLVHQAGSVKVGEVVRYTLTYTPANDRILPTPQALHVKVKNTCAIPLRAAWVHGPYTLHVAAYPSTFNPHEKVESPQSSGIPRYEPLLKAGGSWQAELLVPQDIRQTGADLGKRRSSYSANDNEQDAKGSVTWIIEIASQILFSSSASVNFEVLVGRDERSLDLGFAAVAGHGHAGPGQIKEKRSDKERQKARRNGNVQTTGVYSKAVKLVAEDTETLWDKPPLPSWDDEPTSDLSDAKCGQKTNGTDTTAKGKKKKRKVHLVVVTHGMHSNIGADLLFLKESIDGAVAQAHIDAKERRRARRGGTRTPVPEEHENGGGAHGISGQPSTAPLSGGQDDVDETEEDSDDELTIVRGFPGNAVRTENGIQYLGKRLAKYIFRFTYPDQSYLPVKKGFSRALTDTFKSEADKAKRDGQPSHAGSSIHQPPDETVDDLPYTFTSISFIGHSLGGPVQTYAIAYIHKHNPTFFQQIKPINFVCMASPMLGLSNENPMYVKFALDFGLVGRTGRDLGLSWRPTTMTKTGWNAMIGGLGAGNQEQKQEDPGAKPLLRILPTGPAHQVLRKFRNRTVYSNVVNDGIVPLRTSCLLFLDWKGLGKVDKARRENGLIGTMAEWGWAELTGAHSNAVSQKNSSQLADNDEDDEDDPDGHGETVPQPDEDETSKDSKQLFTRASYDETTAPMSPEHGARGSAQSSEAEQPQKSVFDNFFSFFRNSGSGDSATPAKRSKKTTKALRRGQTLGHDEEENVDDAEHTAKTSNPTIRPHLHSVHSESKRPKVTKGDSYVDQATGELQAPPKTTIFESAGDLLHPPLPGTKWITDPGSRTRTIFHDRVYRPEDIPPPPRRKSSTRLLKSLSSDSSAPSGPTLSPSSSTASQNEAGEVGGMKVEEKIARAYHRDLTWRKVLVRLEPDAHNNMIVRRMFANAYGWPVVKHLCDTHFADSVEARTRDDDEPTVDRVGTDVMDERRSHDPPLPTRTRSEVREAEDEVGDLDESVTGAASSYSSNRPGSSRQNSVVWDDSFFEGSDGEDSDIDERFFVQKFLNPHAPRKPEQSYQQPPRTPASGQSTVPQTPTSQHSLMEGHRGLSPSASRSPTSLKSPVLQKSTFDAANVEAPIVTNKLVQEPEPLDAVQRASTATLGLSKNKEDHVSPTKPKRSA